MSDHIMMCNVPNAGACFVPSCSCGCHKSTEPREAESEDYAATVTGDREKLIAEAQKGAWAEIHGQDPSRKYSVAEVKRIVYSLDNAVADALAAPVEVDEAKLAEVIEYARDRSRKERDIAKESLGQFTARLLVERRPEWLRGEGR